MRQFSRKACCLMLPTIFTLLTLFLAGCGEITAPAPLQNKAVSAANQAQTGNTFESNSATTQPVNGIKKGKVGELFPELTDPKTLKALQINDDWNGLSGVTPIQAHYSFIMNDGLTGEGVFSTGGDNLGGFRASPLLETARAITISLTVTQNFWQTLVDTPVEEGDYRGPYLPTMTDTFPSLFMFIQTDAGLLQVSSASQQKGFFPWSFYYKGQKFTGTDTTAYTAYTLLLPYLHKEILTDLANKSSGHISNKVSPPNLNPGVTSLLTRDYSVPANSKPYSSFFSFAVDPTGKYLATGIDKGVNLFSASDGKLLKTFKGPESYVLTLTFSQDGRYLAANSPVAFYHNPNANNSIWLWDTQAASSDPAIVIKGSFDNITALAFSPAGKTLAAANSDRAIRLFDIATGKQTGYLRGKIPEYFTIYTVTFSPDGQTIAGAGSGDIQTGAYPVKLWDVASGQERPSLKGHTGLVLSIAFSPDGKFLASAGNEGVVRLWDLSSGAQKASLTGPLDDSPITTLRFSPDGKRLAGAYQDGLLVLWDTASEKEISETGIGPVTNSNNSFEMGFSPDSQYIFTANRADDTLNRFLIK